MRTKKCEQCGNLFGNTGGRCVPNFLIRKFCSKTCGATYQWAKKRETFEERFWARMDKRNNGCWVWPSNRKNGYGMVVFNKRTTATHRVAYMLTYGPIREGAYILHSCDNPPCCNPAHLREGSHRENMRDMTERKRRPGLHRDINPASKVSSKQKAAIIREHDALPRAPWGQIKQGHRTALAKKHGVSPHLLDDLVRHRHT